MLVNGHLRCGGGGGATKCKAGAAGPVHGVAQVGVEWGSPAVGPLCQHSGHLCEPRRAWRRRRRSLDLTLCVVPSWALDVVLILSPGRVPENRAPPLQLGWPAVFSVPHWPRVPRAAAAHPSWKLGHTACSPSPVAGSAAGSGALRASAQPHPAGDMGAGQSGL